MTSKFVVHVPLLWEAIFHEIKSTLKNKQDRNVKYKLLTFQTIFYAISRA